MPQGIQPFLPVGPDGLPFQWDGGAGNGNGNGSAANVNVTTLSASAVLQINLDLATERKAAALPLKGLAVYAVTVRKLSGTAAPSVRLHIGDKGEGLEVAEGELRDGLAVKQLAISNAAGAGTLQLEIFGG